MISRIKIMIHCVVYMIISFLPSILLSQTYTPEGKALGGYAFTRSEFSSYWIAHYNDAGDDLVEDEGLNASRVGDASQTYNCHSYAWHTTEGGSNVWINSPGDDYYWGDGAYSNDNSASYISCSEAVATHVSYDGADHSARKIQNSYPMSVDGSKNYVSKWGAWGLYRHQKGHDPYDETDYDFYKLKTTHYGTLSNYNKTWVNAGGQTHTCTDNVTNPSSYTLTIKQGATVKVYSGKKITINGTLLADGSSGNKTTFDANSGTWHGIEVGSSGNFDPDFCVFDDASYPIKFYSADGDVHSCDFTNYTRALLYDNYSTGRVDYCTMEEYGGTGIEYSQYSSGDIRSYNSIQDNYYGVKIDSTSNPDLGTYAGQGYNYISNAVYDVYSDNASTISAEYNYWGSSSPDPSVTEYVDWNPYLSTNPLSKAKAPRQEIVMPELNFNPEDTIGVSEFNEAYWTYLEGKTDDAFAMFSVLVDKYPDYNMGRQSLAFENRILQNEDRKTESESRLLTVSSSYEGKKISGMANSIRVGQLIKDGDYNGAISTAEDIVAKFPNSDLEKYSLYDLGNIHWYYIKDQKTGESYYRQLIADYPKDHLAISALATLGEWVALEKEEQLEKITAINTIPSEFSLDQNYPNPFNPTTTIKYELPEEVHVVVSIYNIQGQLVARLVDEQQKAGHHLVKWNASDQPSGLYVFKMEAGDFASTRKLMLLK